MAEDAEVESAAGDPATVFKTAWRAHAESSIYFGAEGRGCTDDQGFADLSLTTWLPLRKKLLHQTGLAPVRFPAAS